MDSSEQWRRRKRSLSTFKLSSVGAKVYFLLVLFTLLFVFSYHDNILIRPYSLVLQSILLDSADMYWIEDQVSFPDHVLLLVSSGVRNRLMIRKNDKLECVYGTRLSNGSDRVTSTVLSVDEYMDDSLFVRCPLSERNYSKVVDLVWGRSSSYYDGDERLWGKNWMVISWQKVVYEAVLDGETTVVVFVKGLNLRSNRESDPTPFSCHFGLGTWERDERFVLTTKAITAAQEVVRCLLPRSIRSPKKAEGIRVTIGVTYDVHARGEKHELMPSVAKISSSKVRGEDKKKYELCACTMVWNQASAIREWITYHAWLGVERWFIYDNNSDDGIKDATEELDREGYNVSRHMWPWIKTQEAGFSHCALRAKGECDWVSFMDVDEFFYFPIPRHHQGRNIRNLVFPGKNSLRQVVAEFSPSTSIAEIRTTCHSFGPSGLKSPPTQGVTAGYTCRVQSPERHKSIVRPEALDDTLLTVIHHFHLKKGFSYLNLPPSVAVINHYKYQVWETFKAKFSRRVATYVADWKDNQNEGSKDRAPGLGTEAIEPPDWQLRFCEVWDTGLRDFVSANMADPRNGLLPWQRS